MLGADQQPQSHPLVRVRRPSSRLQVSTPPHHGYHGLPSSWAITSLLDTSFFAEHASSPLTSDDLDNLTTFATRLQANLSSGKFRLSVPLDSKLGFDDFWTTQYAYQDMPNVAPELTAELAKSGLVIFKGDLNYRK
jgi:hypothetical protein